MLYETNDETFYEDMEGAGPTLVLFYSEDCKPCHVLMEELMDSELPTMQYCLDYNSDIALESKVVHPSTICLYNEGKRLAKWFAKDWTMDTIMEKTNAKLD